MRVKGNPANCIRKGRRYELGISYHCSNKIFKELCRILGVSAATSYTSQRRNGRSVPDSFKIAKAQVLKLGRYYDGFESTTYRSINYQA